MAISAKFDKRLRSIERNNRRLARGRKTYIDPTGLIRQRPKRTLTTGIPIKGLLTLFLGFVLFKSIILASIGPAAYEQRLELLQAGTIFEQAGAWTLQLDPLTRIVGGMLNPLFGSGF